MVGAPMIRPQSSRGLGMGEWGKAAGQLPQGPARRVFIPKSSRRFGSGSLPPTEPGVSRTRGTRLNLGRCSAARPLSDAMPSRSPGSSPVTAAEGKTSPTRLPATEPQRACAITLVPAVSLVMRSRVATSSASGSIVPAIRRSTVWHTANSVAWFGSPGTVSRMPLSNDICPTAAATRSMSILPPIHSGGRVVTSVATGTEASALALSRPWKVARVSCRRRPRPRPG